MTIRHLLIDGIEPVTEALYEHEGEPRCSRFNGHLTADEVAATLARFRAAAARVVYAA